MKLKPSQKKPPLAQKPKHPKSSENNLKFMRSTLISKCRIPAAFGGLLLLWQTPAARAETLVQPGESICFMGDSITRHGREPNGWCGLVVSGLGQAGIPATQINAGKGGHTSRDMVGRFDNDVLSKKPSWMVLMCGTNDNPKHGLLLEESQTNISSMVEKAQAAGIKVMLVTRPMRGAVTEENDYNAFIRDLAARKNLPLADVFSAMKNAQKEFLSKNPSAAPSTPYLTLDDGTHMNPRGNQVIAECVLGSFGLSPEQIAKIKGGWPDPETIRADPGETGR